MKKINISGNYKLALIDDKDFLNVKGNISSIKDIENNNIKIIDSIVPSNFEIDLQRENLLEDIFFGKNLLLAQDFEMTHLFYSKTFDVENDFNLEDALLEFKGIDTFSNIYLNKKLIASTDNMFLEYEIKANGLCHGSNEIFVHIIPMAIKASEYKNVAYTFAQKYNYDNMYVRKANYMSGWDIFPRILSGGIWKDVFLKEDKKIKISETYLYTVSLEKDYSNCRMQLFYQLDLNRQAYKDFRIEITGKCSNSTFTKTQRVWSKANKIDFTIDNPMLWWPKGSGEQNLYEINVRLIKDNSTIIDEKCFKMGIRTVKLDRTNVTDENGNGKFCFIINHKKIFILGTNWVPLDSLPSQSKEKISKALDLVDDIGCNMIRVWGGGYYEDELFYQTCDEKGFMIWQDFMLGCGMYPQDAAFLSRLSIEIEQVIKRLRQHASLILWAGDNECDCACDWSGGIVDPNTNIITRELMPYLIRMHDFIRDFLPSSPYVDKQCIEKGLKYISEDHLWGPRDYFKSDFYKNALAHFASEIGYHGCPSVKSIKKFISENNLWPYKNNEEWLLHASSPTTDIDEPYAYRIELMANQIKVLFGEDASTIEEFSLLSQISQAEAKKYFIERFRMKKWRTTGIIWWNIIDGCPQFSDAVVDYYFEKKLAYYYIKQSQQPICMMIDGPNDGIYNLYVANDTQQNESLEYTVKNIATDKIIAKSNILSKAATTQNIMNISECENGDILLLEWKGENYSGNNHSLIGTAPFNKEKYIRLLGKIGYNMDKVICP